MSTGTTLLANVRLADGRDAELRMSEGVIDTIGPSHTHHSVRCRCGRRARGVASSSWGRRRVGFAGGWMSPVGDDVVAVFEVRGEHAVVSSEMGAGAWHGCRR